MKPGSSAITSLAVTELPLTVVPFVLPSWRRTKRPSRNVIEAWAREIPAKAGSGLLPDRRMARGDVVRLGRGSCQADDYARIRALSA